MHLHPVEHPDLAHAWPVAEPWLAQACARPGCDLTVEDLRELVDAEAALLVLIVGADGAPIGAGVTQVRDYESGRRSCWVLTLGGAAQGAWRDVIRKVEVGAARNGCGTVEFVGRPAWRRLLPDYRAEPDAAGFHFAKPLEA